MALAALALLPMLVAFLLWASRRRRRDLERFVAADLLATVAPALDPRRARLKRALRVGAATALIVALAGPQWGFHWQEVTREGIDLLIAVDTSRSMLANDVKPDRMTRAKLAIHSLVDQLEGDRVGLIAFAGTAFLQCPLTLDYGVLTQSLDAVEVGLIPKGGTALAAAIDAALAAFEGRQGQQQALILITDGEDHEGNVTEAAARAAERGVKIYTVGLGTSEGEIIPQTEGGFLKDRAGQVVKSRLHEETLQEIAVDTGGVYLRASDGSFELNELYRDYIAAMDRRELQSSLERRFEHRFQILLAIALLLLAVDAWQGEQRPARRGTCRRLRWPRRRAEETP
jgi:Ca-activated chloride channel family protein